VVAIGGQLEARKLLDDIHYIVETLHKKENIPAVHVTYVDTEAPRIFQYSERAKSEFPEYPPVLRFFLFLLFCI
jgi:transcriptional accessory protein Tex/SPT6